MAINWYSHHIGDYDKKTKHLTILEHGCYRLLLDYFYSNGGPFPDDKEKIYRIVRAQNGAERRAVDRCLCQFFDLTNDSLWNQRRAAEEISKYNEIKEIRKNIGAIGGANSAAKRQAKSNPPTPTPTPTIESTIVDSGIDDFEKFWIAWNPFDIDKGSKLKAKKSYLKARKETSHEIIIAGAGKYLEYCHTRQQRTQHVATWINQKRWADEYPDHNATKPANTSNAGSKPTNYERAILAGIRG